jgi:hypothetical protein
MKPSSYFSERTFCGCSQSEKWNRDGEEEQERMIKKRPVRIDLKRERTHRESGNEAEEMLLRMNQKEKGFRRRERERQRDRHTFSTRKNSRENKEQVFSLDRSLSNTHTKS